MILAPDKFPGRDLNETDLSTVRILTGNPAPQKNVLQKLWKSNAAPMLHDSSLSSVYMAAMMRRTLEFVDENNEQGQIAFGVGTLTYASLAHWFSGFTNEHVSPNILTDIGDTSELDVLSNARDIIVERRNFDHVVGQALEAFSLPRNLREIGRIGAGALHLAVVQSDQQPLDPEVASLEALFNAG